MNKITKSAIIKWGDDIMLEISDEFASEIKDHFTMVLKQMEQVKKVDTKNIKAMHYPHGHFFSYLRPDDDSDMITQQQVLNNAPSTKDGYIKINKVL